MERLVKPFFKNFLSPFVLLLLFTHSHQSALRTLAKLLASESKACSSDKSQARHFGAAGV
jgi:hypothetical protein